MVITKHLNASVLGFVIPNPIMNIKMFKATRISSMELFNLASKVLPKNNENNSAYTLKAELSTVATIF